MNESKIQIKVGTIEFSGEGDQEWLTKQLDKVLESIPELLKVPTHIKSPDSKDIFTNNTDYTGAKGLSIINIAGKLNCKSIPDLIIASSAYLHFTQKKEKFTRDEINQTMKKATGYYKNNFQKNLTRYLINLEKSNVLIKSSNEYSIHIDKVNELNAILS